MLSFLRKSDPGEVEFCDRCSSVCDSRCSAEAIREQARDRLLLYGWRQA